jgi:hypothetical protein
MDGTIHGRICFTPVRFFALCAHWFERIGLTLGRGDAKNVALWAEKGRVLVSSNMQPHLLTEEEEFMEAERPAKKAKTSSRKQPRSTKASEKGSGDAVGQVLRSVYRKTVQEDVPSEMLDLLNKLN